MTPQLSQYLNLLRALAALAVYLFHARHFAGIAVPFFGGFGGEAVIVFFVLSGFLITYSTAKHADGVDFMLARLARLWSVALPALLLTLVVDSVGQALCLSCYVPMQPYTPFKWLASIGLNGLFLNQIWNLNIYAGTNGPFWSLSYEFWYYVLLGAGFYYRSWRRIALIAAACAIAGPKILVGLPIWLLGAGAFRLSRKVQLGAGMAWLLWGASLALGVAMHESDAHAILVSWFPATAAIAAQQWNVNFWPESYAIGLLVAVNIVAFRPIATHFTGVLARLGWLIRIGADVSFGLYLFHYPLMYFFKALLGYAGITQGHVYVGALYVLPLLVSVALALYCERTKGTALRALQWLARRCGYRRPALPAHLATPSA